MLAHSYCEDTRRMRKWVVPFVILNVPNGFPTLWYLVLLSPRDHYNCAPSSHYPWRWRAHRRLEFFLRGHSVRDKGMLRFQLWWCEIFLSTLRLCRRLIDRDVGPSYSLYPQGLILSQGEITRSFRLSYAFLQHRNLVNSIFRSIWGRLRALTRMTDVGGSPVYASRNRPANSRTVQKCL